MKQFINAFHSIKSNENTKTKTVWSLPIKFKIKREKRIKQKKNHKNRQLKTTTS